MGSTNDDPSSTSGYYWNILAWINGLQTISYYIRLFGSFWCFCAKGANHKKLKINHQRLGTERWVSPLSISCIFLRVLHVHFSISQCSILGYPLVNIRKTMENNHFSWENSLFLWPFSIVMLVYQRVMGLFWAKLKTSAIYADVLSLRSAKNADPGKIPSKNTFWVGVLP